MFSNFFFFQKTISLSHASHLLSILSFSLPSIAVGNNLFWCLLSLSQSHDKLSQFSPFSLLFLSSHILTVSPLFTNLSLYVSHGQQLFLELVIFHSSLQKPQYYSLLSVLLSIYIVISCFYNISSLISITIFPSSTLINIKFYNLWHLLSGRGQFELKICMRTNRLSFRCFIWFLMISTVKHVGMLRHP